MIRGNCFSRHYIDGTAQFLFSLRMITMFLHVTLIIYIFLIMLHRYGHCYYCKNTPIYVYGQSGPLISSLFSTLSEPYKTFRRTYAYDSNIEIDQGTFHVNKGLIGNIESDNPIVFAATQYNFTLTDNEVKFPILAQPLVIIYNLPNVTNLNLSIQNIIEIYKGYITHWSHRDIAQYNPNVTLPKTQILPVARSDTSDATTTLITHIFSENDKEWESNYGTFFGPNFINNTCCNTGTSCCNSTSWPANVISMFAKQIAGMIGMVASKRYSIGYATVNMIGKNVINRANIALNVSDTNAQLENVEKSVYYFVNQSGPDDLEIPLKGADLQDGYPLLAFSNMVLNYTYNNSIDCCIIQELVGFLDWFLFHVDNSILYDIGYIPLPYSLKLRIKRLVLDRIRCQDTSNNTNKVMMVYSDYLSSLMLPSASQSWQTAIILVVCFVAFGLMLGISYFLYYKNYHVDETRWMIQPSRIKMGSERGSSGRSKLGGSDSDSIHSGNSQLPGRIGGRPQSRSRASSAANQSNQHGIVKELKEFMVRGDLDENKVYLDSLVCKIPQQWSNQTKRTVNRLTNVINKNITTLMGISVINASPYAVFEYCSKGTLHYVLRTSRYNLTEEIKFQFALDIAQGLKYLHHYGFIHGYLNSITCYLDSSWTVKIAQWEKLPICQYENLKDVKEHASYSTGSVFEEARLIELLYVDPKLLTDIKESVDVYSFGNLLIEIFSRKLPYLEEVEEGNESYSDVLTKKFIENKFPKPRTNQIPNEVANLAHLCISSEDQRPNMSTVLTRLTRSAKITTGIVDLIMDTLESHADALEEKVEERTSELKQVTDKMRNLLHEVLPAQIADKLLLGEPVLPEHFECITIFFSEIDGFSTISAESSPTEVMTLLNDLWTAYDQIIDKFDVYKADTIGDNCMICSGLPSRNGMEHCRQIALLALTIMDLGQEFKIKHRPGEFVKLKGGINSGPATAGVIGSKMPQYCVFGDTVNTASRMESTSMPQKIQVSERSFNYFNEYFSGLFEMVFRGEITVKGKGSMRTYWLNNKRPSSIK